MPPDVWTDLRDDARRFATQHPNSGHTILFVPDREAEHVDEVHEGPSADFGQLIGRAFRSDELQLLRISGRDRTITYRKHEELWSDTGKVGGFIAEWFWCPPSAEPISPNDEPGTAWQRLCQTLWELVAADVGNIVPHAIPPLTSAPAISNAIDKENAARLLHWLSWSDGVAGLRSTVHWRARFAPSSEAEVPEFMRMPTSIKQSPPLERGFPTAPKLFDDRPWLKLSGWWWSTIEPAGAALVATIDWLRTAICTEPTQATATAGAVADIVHQDSAEPPLVESKRRRPPRSDADRLLDEGKIAAYLTEHPTATRDEVSGKTGIAAAHVSASKAWATHKAQKTEVRKKNRARGVGGVGDD